MIDFAIGAGIGVAAILACLLVCWLRFGFAEPTLLLSGVVFGEFMSVAIVAVAFLVILNRAFR